MWRTVADFLLAIVLWGAVAVLGPPYWRAYPILPISIAFAIPAIIVRCCCYSYQEKD